MRHYWQEAAVNTWYTSYPAGAARAKISTTILVCQLLSEICHLEHERFVAAVVSREEVRGWRGGLALFRDLSFFSPASFWPRGLFLLVRPSLLLCGRRWPPARGCWRGTVVWNV